LKSGCDEARNSSIEANGILNGLYKVENMLALFFSESQKG
jgi:hypothetical protein